MVKLKEIITFLDKELKTKSIPDESVNGLQVKTSKKEIKKIGFGVDACFSTFEKAKKENVDLLIIHHGIKWRHQKYQNLTNKRINFLQKNKINLYVSHAPLDVSEKYKHEIIIADFLDLKKIKTFTKFQGFPAGTDGTFKKTLKIEKIASILNKKLKTKCRIMKFGKENIKRVAILPGAAGSWIEEVAKKKFDCYITGEIRLSQSRQAQDYKLSIITAGHYATETLGLKLLQKLLEKKFNIKTIFIEDQVPI